MYNLTAQFKNSEGVDLPIDQEVEKVLKQFM